MIHCQTNKIKISPNSNSIPSSNLNLITSTAGVSANVHPATFNPYSSGINNQNSNVNLSQAKIEPIEKKLGIENLQVGFPLLITPQLLSSSSQGQTSDYLTEEIQSVCQTGLLAHLNDMVKNATLRMPTAPQQAKYLRAIDFSNLPYKIVDINGRKNVKEECPAGRMTEIRQIKMSERLFSDNPMERICLTKPDDFLASIVHIPIVPDLKWKQFCITLTQFCPQYKEFVIQALTWPRSYFDPNCSENNVRLQTLAHALDQIRSTTENLPVSDSLLTNDNQDSTCLPKQPMFLNTVTNSNFLETFNKNCRVSGEGGNGDNGERCYYDINIHEPSLSNRSVDGDSHDDQSDQINTSNNNECSVVNTTIQQFEKLREAINSLDNPAYVETLIYGLTSLMAHNDCTHIFSKLYTFGRGRETNCLLTDPQVAPTYKQYVAVAYSDSYYQDNLAMHSSIDLDMLMEDLFQIVFGLDYAQHALGFIHGDLDIRHAVGYLKIDQGRKRMFKWHGRYFKLPGNGRVAKINKFKNASIMINNVTHSANFNAFHHQHSINNDNKLTRCPTSSSSSSSSSISSSSPVDNSASLNKLQTNKTNNKNTFNTDLIRLAATLCGVLAERQIQVHASSPQVEKTFWALMNRLIHCGANLSGCSAPLVGQSGSGNSVDINHVNPRGASMEQLPEFRLKCLQEDDSNNEYCTWNSLIDIPDHSVCHDALPMEQMDFFKMFEVDPSQFSKDPNHLIYTLD